MSGIDETEDMVVQAAEGAVDHAANEHQIELDYTEESLEKVESLLDSLSAAVPKGWLKRRLLRQGPSQEQLLSMATLYGAYVGEVFRRKWGGRWKSHSELHGGVNLPTLEIDGMDIFPTNKVYKRLINGTDDNIWFYFRSFEELRRNPPGSAPG